MRCLIFYLYSKGHSRKEYTSNSDIFQVFSLCPPFSRQECREICREHTTKSTPKSGKNNQNYATTNPHKTSPVPHQKRAQTMQGEDGRTRYTSLPEYATRGLAHRRQERVKTTPFEESLLTVLRPTLKDLTVYHLSASP